MLRFAPLAAVMLTLLSPATVFAQDWSLKSSPSELRSAAKKLRAQGIRVEPRYKHLIAHGASRQQIDDAGIDRAQRTVPAHIAQDPLIPESRWAAWDGFMGLGEAWQLGQGAGAVVAVVDTGVDLTHPDLVNNLWTNPREVPANGLDDDKNGYVDDIHGASVRTGGVPQDDNGHGTHVAGIIASELNGHGVNGIAPKAQIMAVQSLDSEGSGMSSDVANGIKYALANGADIINLSIVADAVTPEDQQVVDAAEKAGVLIVGAAGNEGENISNRPNSPASLDNANLLNVASVDDQGGLSQFSNYGSNVEVAAFGEDIPSTYTGGRYAMLSGTSMATPQVSGVAAVIAGLHGDRGGEEWRNAIVNSVTKVAGLKGSVSSGGIVNLAGALAWEADIAGGSKPKKSVRFRGVKLSARRSGSRYMVKVSWALSGGGASDIKKVTASVKKVTASSAKTSLTLKKLTRGSKKMRLVAYDSSGEARAIESLKFKLR